MTAAGIAAALGAHRIGADPNNLLQEAGFAT
jgi:hypothetical protein